MSTSIWHSEVFTPCQTCEIEEDLPKGPDEEGSLDMPHASDTHANAISHALFSLSSFAFPTFCFFVVPLATWCVSSTLPSYEAHLASGR